ncbi:MAG: insulinase family protein [Ruminococcaceae bacterium]|nr:insulinase family protein [Oscillospiraceae bacterium]
MKTQIFKNDILKENYSLATLDNGLKVYIMEKPEFNTVYAVFGTKYGSIDTAFSLNGGKTVKVPEGIAHFLEHKLFESEDGDAFTKYAKTGAYANAFTSFDKTCYLFSCSSMFEENLDILLNFVQSPYFTAATVEKEQGIIGQEIRMYDDSPSWCVLFNTLRAMYHNNPVKIDIAGTVESIAQIDDKLLYECYNTFYNPSNMFICIAGNVDATKVIAKISSLVKNTAPVKIERITPDEPETVVSGYIEKNLDVALPLFCFGYKLNLKNEPTLYDTVCFDVLLKIISSDITPLYKKLTDEKLINDEFDGEFFTGRGYAALLFDGESAEPKRVAESIKQEVLRIKKEGIDKECFEAVKRDIYGGVIKRYNSVEDIVMSFIDSAVCDYNSFDELEIIKNLKVEDVEKYLEYLVLENTVLSVVSPR